MQKNKIKMLVQKIRKKFERQTKAISLSLNKHFLLTSFNATSAAVISNLLIAYFLFKKNPVLIVVFALLYYFFDTVDGNIARYTKTETKFGAFLDLFSDGILRSFWYIGAAFSGFISYKLAAFCIMARLTGFGIVMLAEKLRLNGRDWILVTGGAEIIFLLGILFNNLVLFAQISVIFNTIIVLFDLSLLLYRNRNA